MTLVRRVLAAAAARAAAMLVAAAVATTAAVLRVTAEIDAAGAAAITNGGEAERKACLAMDVVTGGEIADAKTALLSVATRIALAAAADAGAGDGIARATTLVTAQSGADRTALGPRRA